MSIGKKNILKSLAAAALLVGFAQHSSATVNEFTDDFEGLAVGSGGGELSGLDWKVGMSVYDGVGTYPGAWKFFDGLHPAPNGGAAYSSVATGDATNGGVGVNYMNVYSNYDCCDLGNPPGSQQGHGDGPTVDVVEALVLKEFNITIADIGKVVTFTFDAKRPDFVDDGFGGDTSSAVGNNCTGPCTANAFVKTLDPGAGFSTTNLIEEDMTTISQGTWGTYSIVIDLSDPLLEGQILQVGFQNRSGSFSNTGVYYDNISLSTTGGPVNVPVGGAAIALLGLLLAATGVTNLRKRVNA